MRTNPRDIKTHGQATGLLSPLLQRIRNRRARRFVPENPAILEVGCGDAPLLARLPNSKSYLGIDSDRDIIRQNKRQYPEFDFTCIDIEKEIPCGADFNTILLLAVIEHFSDPTAVLKKLKELLEPTGRIILTTPSPWGAAILKIGARLGLFSQEAAAEHQNLLSKKDLYRLAKECQLKIEHYSKFLLGANQILVLTKAEGAQTSLPVAGNIFNKYQSNNPVVQWVVTRFQSNLTQIIQPLNVRTILDVGCGEGYLTNYLQRLKKDTAVVGVDISQDIVKLADQKYPNIDFRCASAYELPFKEDAFDLVLSLETLEHLERPTAALKEIKRIGRRYYLFSVPQEPTWRILNLLRGRYIRHLGNTPGHLQHWEKKDFVTLLTKHFTIKEVRFPFPWTMVLCEKEPVGRETVPIPQPRRINSSG